MDPELLNPQNDANQDDITNAAFIAPTPMENNESHAMLAMENEHICYVSHCDRKGLRQCAGLRNACANWMCANHGFIAHRQHWCGGGGCGLREHDKYCQRCSKKANKESWMKLALILAVLIFLAIIIVNHYS
eukprot:4954_1